MNNKLNAKERAHLGRVKALAGLIVQFGLGFLFLLQQEGA